MEKIRLIGRNSRLSLLQIERVRKKIESAFPGIIVEVIARSSRGDELPDVPLHTVEGSDFFTQDIFNALTNNEADIAVHSLKDMSAEHFFGGNCFAVTEREDVRDIAIFRKGIEEKLKKGQPIVIGTCSPRREQMAIGFLQRALPRWDAGPVIEVISIRGNIDTRLRKLEAGDYDGIIMATAGLNRLLSSEADAPLVKDLLKDKRLMLLPLIECVPAPCQGAIVAEAIPVNKNAVEVIRKINEEPLMQACEQEKRTAEQYGVGCLQRFGVTTIHYGHKEILFAAGIDSKERSFSKWWGLPKFSFKPEEKILSTTDFMGDFFTYEYLQKIIPIEEPVVFIGNYKTVKEGLLAPQLQSKKVWAAGTKTWFELAKQSIWVEGCADAFGLESLESVWNLPLFRIKKEDVRVLTHQQALENWQQKGWKATPTYILKEQVKEELVTRFQEADIIFWTSYQQYRQYRNVLKKDAKHLCPSGETAELLQAAGISPVIFPNIKSFQQWRSSITPSRSAA